MLKVCVSIKQGHGAHFGECLIGVLEQSLGSQLSDDFLALHVEHPLVEHFCCVD